MLQNSEQLQDYPKRAKNKQMRSRNIKPSFFLNSELAETDAFTRLLFIGLWCFADREGRFEWKPKKIHAAIFPYDHQLNIEQMLCNLMSLHLIACHDNIGYIPNFSKHQHPHPHEAKSCFPPSPENVQLNQCHDMVHQCNDMSCNVMKCQADIRNPDIMNPDTTTPPKNGGESKKIKKPQNSFFDIFWAAYPRKVAKADAVKAWNKINPDEILVNLIVTKIDEYKNSNDWLKDDGQFIPYPATWLNKKRWEDEVLPCGCGKQDKLYSEFD